MTYRNGYFQSVMKYNTFEGFLFANTPDILVAKQILEKKANRHGVRLYGKIFKGQIGTKKADY